MRKAVSLLLSITLFVTLLFPMSNMAFGESNGGVEITDLRTEYTDNPLGIDVTKPRLSWKLESSERGQYQTAYQIQVASSEEKLLDDAPDMWDTEKVESDQSVNIVYDGEPLKSGKRYFWRVKVWDKHGNNSSEWSGPAWWEMGLLESSDWKAEWIGKPKQDPEAFNWTDYKVELDFTIKEEAAGIVFRAKDTANFYMWQINTTGNSVKLRPHIQENGQWEVLEETSIEDVIKPGEEYKQYHLKIEVLGNVIKTYINEILVDTTIDDTFSSGTVGLRSALNEKALYDNVRVYTDEGILFQDDFSNPDVSYFPNGSIVNGQLEMKDVAVSLYGEATPTAPLLRKEFNIKKPIKRARAYVTGLGYYKLWLNGEKVGDRVLDPGRTDYNKRILYTAYDVTEYLKQGTNAAGAEITEGFYTNSPVLLLQIEIRYTDGTTQRIVSDKTWKATGGPTIYNSPFEGETYDAQREKNGWTKAGYEDSEWHPVEIMEVPDGSLVAQDTAPIKVTETITPVDIAEPKPGVYVFDMGRTIAGWAQLSVSGSKGTKITMQYGEKLNDDGTVNAESAPSIRERFQRDVYVLKGKSIETWEPSFSYKGFRYVEVTGLPNPPTKETIKGKVVHNAIENVGEFKSSNELFNWIHEAMQDTILHNLHSIPTDTPAYEKNGWLGDAQLGGPSMIYNFDMARFLAKWINDIQDTQKESGQLSRIAPYENHEPAPAWTGAYPIVMWDLYRYYDDQKILRSHYESLTKYIEWEIERLNDGISSTSLGDWLPPGYGTGATAGIPPEDTRLAATAYVYKSIKTTADIARVLEKEQDALRYDQVAEHIKDRFNEEFLNKDKGFYDADPHRNLEYRQTSNALPLAFGMVPEEYESSAVASLVKDIKERDGHLNTGALGTSVLLPVLTEHGYGDVAYTVADQKTYPSWGFWREQGATTLWEAWGLDARSHNHYFFGTVDQWFYEYVAGIKQAAPGYKEMTIRPYIVGDLTKAAATTDTPQGKVSSSWELSEQGLFRLDVKIPENTTATIYVSADRKWDVMENGQPAHTAEGIKFVRMEDGNAVYEVGSGDYHFTVYPPSAAHMNSLVKFFAETGEFANHGAARALDVHLTAVNLFEEKGAADKVVKHFNSFKKLLDYQKENELISENAYDVFTTYADWLIDKLVKDGVSAELNARDTEVHPGDHVQFEAVFENSGKYKITDLEMSLATPDGWDITAVTSPSAEVVKPGENFTVQFNAVVPEDQALTKSLTIEGNAVYRKFGEEIKLPLHKTVKVITPIRIQTAEADPVKPGEETTLHVTVKNDAQQSFTGNVTVEAPSDWTVEPTTQNYQLDVGTEKNLTFTVSAPEDAKHGAELHISATYEDYDADETTTTVHLPGVSWEFDTEGDAQGWQPTHDLTDFTVSNGVLMTQSTGGDPYMILQSPLSLDASHGVVVQLTMKTSVSSGGQIFWATEAEPGFSEDKSTHFDVESGGFHVYHVEIPPQDSDMIQLRIDPLAQEGDITIESIRILR